MKTEKLPNFSEFLRRRREEARDRVSQLEGETRKRVEEILDTLKKQEILENLKTGELKTQFADLRSEVLDLFGLATREEVERLTKEVQDLQTSLKKATTRKTAKKPATKKATKAKKPAAKKATAAKKPAAKKPAAKKATKAKKPAAKKVKSRKAA